MTLEALLARKAEIEEKLKTDPPHARTLRRQLSEIERKIDEITGQKTFF